MAKTTLLCLLLCPTALLAGVQLLASGPDRLSFNYEPGQAAVELTADGTHRLDLSDADHLAEPGELDLPSKIFLIGLPQTGGASVSYVTEAGPTFADVRLNTVVRMSYEPDTAWFDRPGKDAPATVEIGPIEQLRGVRFLSVTIHPADYDAGQRRLLVYNSVKVTVRFDHRARVSPRPDPLDNCLATMLLNGEQALDWKLDPPGTRPNPYARSSSWLRIRVDSTTLYRITGCRRSTGLRPRPSRHRALRHRRARTVPNLSRFTHPGTDTGHGRGRRPA